MLTSNKLLGDGDAAGPGRHPESHCSRLMSLLERRGPKELGNWPQVTQWRQDQGTELAFSSSSSSLSYLCGHSSLLRAFHVPGTYIPYFS